MRAQVEQRVSELKAEHKKGQEMLAELEGREAELRLTRAWVSDGILGTHPVPGQWLRKGFSTRTPA